MAVLTSLQGQGEYTITRKDCLLISKACHQLSNTLNEKEREQSMSIAAVFSKLANQ